MEEQPTDHLRDFLITHDAPCPKCGYNLRGLQQSTCPECGLSLRLVVAGPEQPFVQRVEWLRIASHPVAILAVATLAMDLAHGPLGAALILGAWASVMMFLRLWDWAPRFLGAPGVNPQTRWKRRMVVYAAFGAWTVCSLFVLGSAIER